MTGYKLWVTKTVMGDELWVIKGGHEAKYCMSGGLNAGHTTLCSLRGSKKGRGRAKRKPDPQPIAPLRRRRIGIHHFHQGSDEEQKKS
jgi:hypothetical protein